MTKKTKREKTREINKINFAYAVQKVSSHKDHVEEILQFLTRH